MSDDAAPAAARALEVLERNLGSAIVGVYLYGSSVAGGLKPQSDVDILVASATPVVGHTRQRLVEALLASSGRNALDGPSRPLDVTLVATRDVTPWRFPPVCDLLFGEWLRDDFEAGRIHPPTPRPDLAIVLTSLLQNNRLLAGRTAMQVFEPVPAADLRRAVHDCLPALLRDLRGDERNVVLTLARMWVTLATGTIVSKDAAAAWAIDRSPAEIAATLDMARTAYLGRIEDDWSNRTEQVDAFVRHAGASIDLLR